MSTTGRGYGTSGNRKRSGTGRHHGSTKTERGAGMDEIVQGELPANPEAEIEARRSDRPTKDLPPDAAAIRKRRGKA